MMMRISRMNGLGICKKEEKGGREGKAELRSGKYI